MRRVMLMMAAVAMMVSLFAAAAYAAEIVGTTKDETLRESDRNDQITARAGDDMIFADEDGDDTDRVRGNRGDDIIRVDDGDDEDHAIGGKGDDVCYGDTGDDLDCDIPIIVEE